MCCCSLDKLYRPSKRRGYQSIMDVLDARTRRKPAMPDFSKLAADMKRQHGVAMKADHLEAVWQLVIRSSVQVIREVAKKQ